MGMLSKLDQKVLETLQRLGGTAERSQIMAAAGDDYAREAREQLYSRAFKRLCDGKYLTEGPLCVYTLTNLSFQEGHLEAKDERTPTPSAKPASMTTREKVVAWLLSHPEGGGYPELAQAVGTNTANLQAQTGGWAKKGWIVRCAHPSGHQAKAWFRHPKHTTIVVEPRPHAPPMPAAFPQDADPVAPLFLQEGGPPPIPEQEQGTTLDETDQLTALSEALAVEHLLIRIEGKGGKFEASGPACLVIGTYKEFLESLERVTSHP